MESVHRIDERTSYLKQLPPVDEDAASELTINMKSNTINSMDISLETELPTSVEGLQLDLNSKVELDGGVSVSPLTILGDVNLGKITGDVRSVHITAPADDAGDMHARGEGALIEANWFIRANCSTSLNQLGRLVRAHTVVNVLGAGSRHSGKYFVACVRHVIDAAAHRMDLELVRNGWSK